MAYDPSSIDGARACNRSQAGTSQPSESASRTIIEKREQTVAASRNASRETPAAYAASACAGSSSSGRSVSTSRKASVAASSGRTGAVRQSSTIACQTSSPSAYDATAPCEPVQNRHWLSCDVNAAKSSRSPALQSEGPRITSCSAAENGCPKSSGRYISVLTT